MTTPKNVLNCKVLNNRVLQLKRSHYIQQLRYSVYSKQPEQSNMPLTLGNSWRREPGRESKGREGE